MGFGLSIVRAVATLVLGATVFFGFLFLLLVNNFSDKLVDSGFYTDTIDDVNAYDRVYDEVLLDPELAGTTEGLLGDIKVLSHQEIIGLMEEIFPREYLRSQVEGSIQRTVDYFNEDKDVLELYIEVGPLLQNTKPVLFRYIDGRIDRLVEEPMGDPACSVEKVNEVAGKFETVWKDLAEGTVPESVPSIREFPETCRRVIFDLAFDMAVDGAGLDQRTKEGLLDAKEEVRTAFIDGDTRQVLKQAARPLATPLMDDAIDRVRQELDEQDRLDLLYRIAAWNDDLTEEELQDNIDSGRDWMNMGRHFGEVAAMIMVVGGAILIGVVHFPNLSGGLRWAGITLLFTGIVFFITGKVLESRVPDGLQELVGRGASGVGGIPPSVTDLAGDLLVSFGRQLTEGFTGPSLTLLLVGILLIGGSFAVRLLRPFLPGVR